MNMKPFIPLIIYCSVENNFKAVIMFMRQVHTTGEILQAGLFPIKKNKPTNVLLELSVQFLNIVLLIQDGCNLAIPVAMETDIK